MSSTYAVVAVVLVSVTTLGVGAYGWRFSRTTRKSLVDDLRTILTRQYVDRARDIAAAMTKPAESVGMAADLLEKAARDISADSPQIGA